MRTILWYECRLRTLMGRNKENRRIIAKLERRIRRLKMLENHA